MPIPAQDPIVTIPVSTPFDQQDRVDFAALERNVGRWLETPLRGFIIGTASGEEWFLSEADKLQIMRTVKGALDESRFLVGGIDIKVNDRVSFIPNVETIIYREVDGVEDVDATVMPRLTFSVTF